MHDKTTPVKYDKRILPNNSPVKKRCDFKSTLVKLCMSRNTYDNKENVILFTDILEQIQSYSTMIIIIFNNMHNILAF